MEEIRGIEVWTKRSKVFIRRMWSTRFSSNIARGDHNGSEWADYINSNK